MNLSDWISLAVLCVLGAASPGPSLAVILAIVQLSGRRGGMAAAVGHGLGIFLYAMIASAGLSFVITYHSSLFKMLQILGSLVIVWIGIRVLFKTHFNSNSVDTKVISIRASQSFFDGLVIAVFNPKIAAFFISLFSLFLVEGQSIWLHIAIAVLAGTIDVIVYVFIVVIITMESVKNKLAGFAVWKDYLLGGLLTFFGVLLLAQNALAYFS